MYLNQINWGDDTAEKDEYLLEYFVQSESYARLAQMQKNIVVGRKGSGKSALLKKLSESFYQQEKTVLVKITPDFKTLRSVLNDDDLRENFGEEIFFQHTWLRQIMTDFHCNAGNMFKGDLCRGSYEYARELAKRCGRTHVDFLENISEILKGLKLKAGNLGEFGLSIEKELREASGVDAMKHHLHELSNDGVTFVALIDDLDLGWDNSPLANNLLLGLLSATTYLEAVHQNIHPIVFLREDVYELLLRQTQHSDKYRDVERIRWDRGQLKTILEHRIIFNFEQSGEATPEDPFYSVFPPTVSTSNTDRWMIERTLSRPRELIQLARYYTEGLNSQSPSDDKLKDAEPGYSDWKLQDLCSEYANQYPNLQAVMSYWKTKFFRTKYHLPRAEIDDMLLEILGNVPINESWFNELSEHTDTDGFLNVLYEIGFLGDFVVGGGGGSRTYYSYEGHHEPLFREVQIHPCFRRAVNTVERIRSK